MKNLLKAVCFWAFAFLFSLALFTPSLLFGSSASIEGQFIPRTPPGPNAFIGNYFCSSTAPCPVGIADYGVNKASKYSYHAVTFDSWANFTKLGIGTSPIGIGCLGSQSECMTIQQNLVDYSVFEKSAKSTSGEYWAQDVPFIAQSRTIFTINQLDNIWNMSSPTAQMGGIIYRNLLGNCVNKNKMDGQPQYYYCQGKLTIKTTLPFEILMTTTTGVLASGSHSGSSYIKFGIWVYHSGKLVGGSFFDEVAFNGPAASNPYFFVSGSGKNPYGLFNDAETVLCGPGGGSSVKITKIAASFTEAYILSGSTTLTRVTHSWSAGADTAETVSNVKMSSTVVGIGTAVAGADNNNQLW
jgi:Thermopsin